jgi:hypothetical protein
MANNDTTLSTADQIENQILAINDEATADHVADVLTRLDAYMQRGKALRETLEPLLTEWIKAHGELRIGEVRYYVGPKRTTKCIDVPGCVEALLIASGGDFGTLCEFFASQPLKYGACKEPLGEAWAKFFNVVVEEELKDGEVKPVKKIQRVDERFIK